MNAFKKALVAVAIAMAGLSTGAQAAIIGDTITLTSTDGTSTAIIDSGKDKIEFENVKSFFNFDFTETKLFIDISNLPIVKYDFEDNFNFVFSGFQDVISGFTFVDSAPKFNIFTSDNYSYDAHTITINFSGAQAQNKNSRMEFNILTTAVIPEVPAPGNAVPEPASAALLGLGLLAIATARRKFAKK